MFHSYGNKPIDLQRRSNGEMKNTGSKWFYQLTDNNLMGLVKISV